MQIARMQIGLTALLLSGVVVACGESRQEKFEKAMRSAEVAHESLESSRKEFASREVDYDEARSAAAKAEEELASARQKLDAATTTYDSARVEVSKWADDASVSRVLQQQLLAEPVLEAAALSARVEQGVAILEGSAPDDAARERAAEIAREVPGVVDVQSNVAVAAPAPAPVPAPEPVIEAMPPIEVQTEPAH